MQRHDLGGGAFVDFDPAWLPADDADDCFRTLLETIAWEQGTIVLFGREIPEPRLTAWIGDRDYTYSGRTVKARPWPELLDRLRARLETATGGRFNSVLLNRYRSGRDSMGYHSDAEPELGVNPLIASVSLGAPRRFVLRSKRGPESARPFELSLGHGSLLVMGGTCQHAFRHAVPKERGASGERINLTFRRVIR